MAILGDPLRASYTCVIVLLLLQPGEVCVVPMFGWNRLPLFPLYVFSFEGSNWCFVAVSCSLITWLANAKTSSSILIPVW